MQTFETIGRAREAKQVHPRCADIVCAIEVELATGDRAIILSLTYMPTLSTLLSKKPMPEITRLVRQVEDFQAAAKAQKTQERIDRENRIASLFPGLKEIEKAQSAEEEDRYRFEKMMERGDGFYKSCKPPVSSDALRAQYPAANAYLHAQAYANGSNVGKFSAGMRAVERLVTGEDYKIVIAEMEKEWSAHVHEHIGD